jgi:hypothetical protein
MDKTIVYILSTNFAGSHFLALQLGSNTRCASIGELHHFERKRNLRRACHICPSDQKCPVFTGLQGKSADALYDKIFDNLEKYDNKISVLIDNSKKTNWASCFLNQDHYKMKYIHLIRDPRALVRRWILTEDTFGKKWHVRWATARRYSRKWFDILTGDEINVYLWKWLHQNKLITDFIKENSVESKIITYHDLALNTDRVLGDLMDWIGFEYDPAQKDYWNFQHHSSVKEQYIKPPAEGKRIFDLRWKELLDEATCERITHFTPINEYLDQLGIILGKEGLTSQ